MHDISKIVIPRIKEEWEDFAYALRYDSVVNDIKEQYDGDPRKCCREVLLKWLKSDDGGPKTWSALLEILRDIDHLSAATEEITKELTQAA